MFNLKQFFMQKKNLFSSAILCTSMFLFTGCDQIVSSLDNPVNSYLQITEAPKGMLEPGQTFELKATSINSDKAIVFESLTPEVATVDAQTGVLTAVDEGKAKIKVSVEKSDYYNADDSILVVTVQYPDIKAPLTLEAKEDGKITVSNTLAETDKPIVATIIDTQYKKTVKEITENTDIEVKAGERVRFESTNATLRGKVNITTDKEFYVYGNVMSLLNDSEEGKFAEDIELTGSANLQKLFNGADKIINHETRDIVLPAKTLAQTCYNEMFNGCKSITRAPELPAKEMAKSCYNTMFKDCRKLEKAPALPATTLAENCYYVMFRNCYALTEAPDLPAETLFKQCYYQMFSNCRALKKAPALPATTLADDCYNQMFYGCISLATAPALPATTLAQACYRQMFQGCTAITKAPALNATIMKVNCYNGMFSGCTSLTTPPTLDAKTLDRNCYQNMFYDCTSLATAPALPATTLANNCYGNMFQNCTSLTKAPDLLAETIQQGSYTNMFNGCTKLNYIKCMATNAVARKNNALQNWVNGVAATGTFVYATGAVWTWDAVNGTPSGWTLVAE